jgi:hypothetical protein
MFAKKDIQHNGWLPHYPRSSSENPAVFRLPDTYTYKSKSRTKAAPKYYLQLLSWVSFF